MINKMSPTHDDTADERQRSVSDAGINYSQQPACVAPCARDHSQHRWAAVRAVYTARGPDLAVC